MRSLPYRSREARRIKVIRLRLRGWTYEAIARQTGLSRTGVFNICQRHELGGLEAIKEKRRKPGRNRTLTPDQESIARKIICEKTPEQMKIPLPLWSRKAVQKLFFDHFNIALTLEVVGKYLVRWGFTLPDITVDYHAKYPPHSKTTLYQRYPDIYRAAKSEGARLQWLIKSTLTYNDTQNSSSTQSYFAPGTQSAPPTRTRQIIFSITNRGTMYWKVYNGNNNSSSLIDFMERIIEDSDKRRVFLISDPKETQIDKTIEAFLKRNNQFIRIFQEPSHGSTRNETSSLNTAIDQQHEPGKEVSHPGNTDYENYRPQSRPALPELAGTIMLKM